MVFSLAPGAIRIQAKIALLKGSFGDLAVLYAPTVSAKGVAPSGAAAAAQEIPDAASGAE
jgi:hypothetical protein